MPRRRPAGHRRCRDPGVHYLSAVILHLDDIAGATAGQPVPLFPAGAFTTPWRALALLELEAGQRCSRRPGADQEVGYLVLRGEVSHVSGAAAGTQVAPAVLLCGVGCAHELAAGPRGTRLLQIEVACHQDRAPGRVAVAVLSAGSLRWREAIHGGGGRIATRHVWRPEDFASSWAFVDHAILSPGSSVGRHYHQHLDEAFVVLAGRGWMTIGDDTEQIGPGAVTLQAAGVGHGLFNPFPEDLGFARLAVAVPGQTFATVDLDDDLSTRRPRELTT